MCDVQVSKVEDVFETLSRILCQNGEVNAVSEKFSALNTNAERVFFAKKLLQKYSLFPKGVQHKKNDELSIEYRQDGNEAFKTKNDFVAWSYYTKSIIYAKNKSECLALAYANRSAVLYGKKLYKQCLEDITNAFKNNYPKHLHEKLIQREEKARVLLSTQEGEKYYEPFNPIDSNKTVQCATASVEIRNTKELGRHVVAVKKICFGEVIAVEKPYAKVLLKKHFENHCYFCLELCYNLKPCDSCVYAMYCSKKCQLSAWNQFHRYECPLLATLYSLDISKLALLSLRIALSTKPDYNEISTYKPDYSVYKSECYEEVHFLEANTHLRNSADLFPRAITAAILGNLVKTMTPFYRELNNCNKDEEIFSELVMRHLQTSATNFHEISETREGIDGNYFSGEVGAGVYSFLSLLNHSCSPNVVRHCHGSAIVLRAIKPIPQGTELLDNYGYHHAVMNRAERQRMLKRQYYFDCNCEACTYNWPLYNFMSSRGGNLFNLPSSTLDTLRQGDRKAAITVLSVFLYDYDNTKEPERKPNKSFADLQELIKQCYALLGNRKSRF